jgi:hypothetical protein
MGTACRGGPLGAYIRGLQIRCELWLEDRNRVGEDYSIVFSKEIEYILDITYNVVKSLNVASRTLSRVFVLGILVLKVIRLSLEVTQRYRDPKILS